MARLSNHRLLFALAVCCLTVVTTTTRAAADDAAVAEAATVDPLDEVRTLARTRSIASARALHVHLKSKDEAIRIEAMLGLARLGLRSDVTAERLHKRVMDDSTSSQERWAAVTALGAVGDGRDVGALIELASPENEDGKVRSASFRALAAITGARLPFVHARWTYWWKKHEVKAETRVRDALEALEAAPSGERALLHEATIAGHGWAVLELVEPALKRWLTTDARRLGVQACRLAAYLRLGDLTEDLVAASQARRSSDELRKAAEKAARRLGVAEEKPAR